MAFVLQSPHFKNGQQIPEKFTGEGEDISPLLDWDDPPRGTREFALICEDPDAPTPEPFVHWVIYKISVGHSSLAENIPPDEELSVPPSGALQGRNSFDQIGYNGPMPPPGHGPHRYYFRLYALDQELHLKPGLTRNQLMNKIRSHILGSATLMGRYERAQKKAA
jgi:Raf kinase inhibitor-like YbhB/YbcL family protein